MATVAHPDRAEQMIRHLAQIVGLGLETATVLVREMLCRPFRDRRAVAGFAGLTGTPFRSGGIEREQGIGKNGNARVRRIVVQLAWRWLPCGAMPRPVKCPPAPLERRRQDRDERPQSSGNRRHIGGAAA